MTTDVAQTNPPFTWTPVAVGAGASDAGFTRTQSALYARVDYVSTAGGATTPQPIGLAQRCNWQGQSGNGPVRGIGEPWAENKPGDMYFTFSVDNFSIRRKRLMDMFSGMFPSLKGDINMVGDGSSTYFMDFRTLCFQLAFSYTYLPPGGGDTPYESTSEYLVGCWIQTWSGGWSDPNALHLEGVTGWAGGYLYNSGGSVLSAMGNVAIAGSAELGGATQSAIGS